jgi:cysteine desulfurase family protein
VIYLDNAATSFPKPEGVYRALDKFARESLANPGRSGHRMALGAERAMENARHRLNRFFNGRDPNRFIFTLNCTDALNIAMKGVLNPGDHAITSDLEHNSVSRPLEALAKAGTIALTRVKVDSGGTIEPDSIRQAMTPRTKLVALTHGSNVLGTVQPIAEIGKIVCEFENALFLVDAAQTAGMVPIDLQKLDVDMLAMPGHKCLFGPTGTGVLYVAPRVKLRPWREGGTGGNSTDVTQPTEYPHWLEGGTPNVLGIVGMIAGLDFVEEKTPDALRKHELELCEQFRTGLLAIGGFEFFGHSDTTRRVGAISFRHESLAAPILGGILDEAFAVAVRPGLHCSPYVHRAMGTLPDGLVRVSPGPFNTADEISQLIDALKEATAGMS